MGAPAHVLHLAGFTDEVCHVYLATGLSDAQAETDEHERIDIEVRPLAELDALIDEVQRLEDADRAARARAAGV